MSLKNNQSSTDLVRTKGSSRRLFSSWKL